MLAAFNTDMKYRREIHPIINRLKTIWLILTSKEFILVRVKRFEGGRNIAYTCRTNDNTEGDYLTLKAACLQIEKKLPNCS